MSPTPIPNEQQPMTPYLIVREAARAIEFYVAAFGARELFRLAYPDGKVGHAELEVLGAKLSLADEHPDFGALSPATIGGTPVMIHVYVADVDRLVEQAVAAGGTLQRPVRDEFYGDRVAVLLDPFGHKWHLATRKEAVSVEEMLRRWASVFA